MSRDKINSSDAKPPVPAYIVTFSDMVTLLLTFFVMLLSLAQEQRAELFNQGRQAFVEYIRYWGIGTLFGRTNSPDFGNVQMRYFIKDPDKSFDARSIDAREEDVRRLFKRVAAEMEAIPSQITGAKTDFSVAAVRFQGNGAELNDEGKAFLRQYVQDLRTGGDYGDVKLYVLGLASEQREPAAQWMISARRAQAVAEYLGTLIPQTNNWPVYSWGAGPGGAWVDEDSPASQQSQVVIGVVRGAADDR